MVAAVVLAGSCFAATGAQAHTAAAPEAPPAGYLSPPQPGDPPQGGYPPPSGYPPPPRQYYRGPYGQPTPDPGSHVHDGLYLRMQFGLGYTSMSTDAGVKASGGGAGFGIAVGGTIMPHVIVYGTILDNLVRDPTVRGDAVAPIVSGGNAGEVGIGVGLAYYTDVNVFVATSFLGSRLEINDGNGETIRKSDWGFTFEGLLGKEWWVSDNWGLGVSAQMLLGSMQDSQAGNLFGNPPNWSFIAFSALLSATYN